MAADSSVDCGRDAGNAPVCEASDISPESRATHAPADGQIIIFLYNEYGAKIVR